MIGNVYINATENVSAIVNTARDALYPDNSRKLPDVYLGSHKSKKPEQRKAQKKARKIQRRK